MPRASSCAPEMARPLNGVPATPSPTKPTVRVRRSASERACALGRKPSSATAANTRSRVSVEMPLPGRSLITNDTVVEDTPARRATSAMVGRRSIAAVPAAAGLRSVLA